MVTSEHVARTIEHKAKKVLKMLKRGVKFTPTQPDVLTILEKLKTINNRKSKPVLRVYQSCNTSLCNTGLSYLETFSHSLNRSIL